MMDNVINIFRASSIFTEMPASDDAHGWSTRTIYIYKYINIYINISSSLLNSIVKNHHNALLWLYLLLVRDCNFPLLLAVKGSKTYTDLRDPSKLHINVQPRSLVLGNSRSTTKCIKCSHGRFRQTNFCKQKMWNHFACSTTWIASIHRMWCASSGAPAWYISLKGKGMHLWWTTCCATCARGLKPNSSPPEKWCLGDNPFLLGPMFTGYDVRVEEGYFRCCTTTQHVVHHHPIGIKVERFLPTVSLDSAKRWPIA